MQTCPTNSKCLQITPKCGTHHAIKLSTNGNTGWRPPSAFKMGGNWRQTTSRSLTCYGPPHSHIHVAFPVTDMSPTPHRQKTPADVPPLLPNDICACECGESLTLALAWFMSRGAWWHTERKDKSHKTPGGGDLVLSTLITTTMTTKAVRATQK